VIGRAVGLVIDDADRRGRKTLCFIEMPGKGRLEAIQVR